MLAQPWSLMDRRKDCWTQVKRQEMPQGDVLYTIFEVPETRAKSHAGSEVGNCLRNSRSNSSLKEITRFESWSTTASKSTTDETASSLKTDSDDLGSDFEAWAASQEVLADWKSKVERMEKQKQTLRSWMSETVVKVHGNIKKMIEFTENVQNGRAKKPEPDSMYSNCSSAEDLSIISSTLMVDCVSSADSSGQLTPETKKTSSAENNGLEADNHQIRDTEESKTKKSSCVGGLSGAYCYLEFGQLLSNPQDAIAALDENVKQHALDTIKTLTADEWERVRRLYGMLKRAGKVDQLLVYEFARDIVKSCKGEENMEKFLSEFDADQSEAAFKFGLTLLTIFHASFVLAGSNDDILTFSNSKTDQRAFPELAHSARISGSKNPEEIFQRMPVQRRNFFSGHNRRCDVLRNSMAKIAPRKYVNPAYAHVKSRYMDALKPKPRMGSARTKGYYRSPGSQNSRDQNQAKSKTAPCTNERQRLSMLYDQDDRPTTESTFASTTEIESATAESEKASELLGDSYKTASSRRNKILNVPSNSMISLVKPRKLCNSLASDSETEPDTGKCKKLSMKTGHYQGMGDCSKPQRTNQSKIDNDRTDKSVSTEMETASKPSWKLLKIPPDDDSDATASSCEEKVWKSSNSTMDSSKIELARSNRGNFMLYFKSSTTEKTEKKETVKIIDSASLERKGDSGAESSFGKLQRRLPGIITSVLSTLMMHLVVASTVILSGRALCMPNEQEGMACNLSIALKSKLRSLLIKALQVVDDF